LFIAVYTARAVGICASVEALEIVVYKGLIPPPPVIT